MGEYPTGASLECEVRSALRWARQWAEREHGLLLDRFVQVHLYGCRSGPEWVASDRRCPAVFVLVWRAGLCENAIQEARDSCSVTRQFGKSGAVWGISKRGRNIKEVDYGADYVNST